MNEDIRAWWLNVSDSRLFKHLVKQKMNEQIVSRVVARVRELKAQRKSEKFKRLSVAKSWIALVDGARAERQTVFVMKSQLKKIQPLDQRKWDALCAYEAVLTQTVEKLRRLQRSGLHTPKSFVPFIKEETGKVIPNDGEHWADYVKAIDRQRITALFDRVPPPARGKAKTPFERRISKAVHKAQRLELVKRLNGEIASAEREYEVTQDPDIHDKLNRQLDTMYRAQYELDRLPATAPLPATWHGLLNRK
jgi:hypothetical protein